MSERWVLVDGYSVLHAWPTVRKRAGRSFAQQREALVQMLRQYADHTGAQVTMVFDGYAAKHRPEIAEPTPGIEVVYSEQGKTADDVIERHVGLATQRSRMLVVTSDNVERQTVENLGASSMSAEVFLAEVNAALTDLAKTVRHHGRPRRIGSVRERFH